MNDEMLLAVAGFAGMLLGAFFFGGLWWTVRKCLITPHPAIWLLGSGLIRMSATLAGFYFVSGGQWQRLLACLMGFIIARLIVTWLSRAVETNSAEASRGRSPVASPSGHYRASEPKREASHAS